MRYIWFVWIFVVNLNAQIVLSEIMYNPEENESVNEFIEIVNTSSTDTLDLSGWLICDKSGCDQIETFSRDAKLPPGGYGVLFGGGYSLTDGIYREIIPESTLMLKVDDSRIGNGLGNESDSLYVYDQNGVQVVMMGYTNVAGEGYSLEKIRLENGDASENWIQSLDSLGTPGSINSVSPLDIDVCIETDSLVHEPVFPKQDDEVYLTAVITNRGNQTISGSVLVTIDNTYLDEQPFPELIPDESVDVLLVFSGLDYGENILDITVSVSGDMNPVNNTAEYAINVSHPFGVITLNEFLCEPGSNQSEFVELYSFGDTNLKGWTIRDKTSVKYLPDVEVEPDQFVVVAADSGFQFSVDVNAVFLVPTNGFPALNNDGDKITIFDQTGVCIDSLRYSSDWPIEPGRSTEKYRPNDVTSDSMRWGVSVDETAMTPGQQNSLYYDLIPQKGTVKCYPNPFSPDGDGNDDQLFILCSFPYEQVILKLEIFDMVGRNIVTPCWNQYAAQEILLTWDGLREDNSPSKIGMYLIKVTARDVYSGRNWEGIQTVVLAKRL